jgi:hypothetical protein
VPAEIASTGYWKILRDSANDFDCQVAAIDLNRSKPDWHFGGSVNRRYQL